mmetsp:Transcript_10284/g.18714  ORF Transcript_10284/g.18714 Transcript_10284/m.18714 type:complete len:231 (+) Transcript_10284:460-1152(+)
MPWALPRIPIREPAHWSQRSPTPRGNPPATNLKSAEWNRPTLSIPPRERRYRCKTRTPADPQAARWAIRTRTSRTEESTPPANSARKYSRRNAAESDSSSGRTDRPTISFESRLGSTDLIPRGRSPWSIGWDRIGGRREERRMPGAFSGGCTARRWGQRSGWLRGGSRASSGSSVGCRWFPRFGKRPSVLLAFFVSLICCSDRVVEWWWSGGGGPVVDWGGSDAIGRSTV